MVDRVTLVPLREEMWEEDSVMSRVWQAFFNAIRGAVNEHETAIDNKISKLTAAVVGNFVIIASGGGLADAGVNPDDFAEAIHNHKSADQGGDYPWADLIEIDVAHIQAWRNVVNISADYQALDTDCLIKVVDLTGNIDISLPDATRHYYETETSRRLGLKIKRKDTTVKHAVYLRPFAYGTVSELNQTIDDEEYQELFPGDCVQLESDEENWVIV